MNLLILLVVVVAVIAIAQLTKVYELSRSLRKNREEEISAADNKLNANLWLVWMFSLFSFVIYLYAEYGDFLPDSASEHGESMDNLMQLNLWMITVVFFGVNFMLYYFAWKYRYQAGRQAKFFAHDSRLEMVWTLIPGVSMAFIIVYGLITWNKMTGPASSDAIQIELYSKQFDWTARYPGDNKVFGAADFNLIGTTNALGIVTQAGVAEKLAEIDKNIAEVTHSIEDSKKNGYTPDSYIESLEDQLYKLKRHKQRILDLNENEMGGISQWEAGADDRIVKGEFHIPVGKEVEFLFRSQDVIHSAFMPHFRAQMNTVPGVPTRFKMTPTLTTAEMRQKLGNDKFDYILLCNKICGAAHFNMKIKVIVDSPEEYAKWLSEQKTFVGAEEAPVKEEAAKTDSLMVAEVK